MNFLLGVEEEEEAGGPVEDDEEAERMSACEVDWRRWRPPAATDVVADGTPELEPVVEMALADAVAGGVAGMDSDMGSESDIKKSVWLPHARIREV